MKRSLQPLLLSLGIAAGFCSADELVVVSPKVQSAVADLRGRTIEEAQARAGVDSLSVSPAQRNLRQHSTVMVGKGDFHLRATVVCDRFEGRGAAITFDGGSVVLDDPQWGAVLNGRLFGGGRFPFESERPPNAVAGAPISVEIQRLGGEMAVRINEFPMGTIGIKDFVFGRIGFELAAGSMRVLECTVDGDTGTSARPTALFSAADGDIDEYRDPSVASGGPQGFVTAIAVTTADSGETHTSLWARRVDERGATGVASPVELGGIEPDFAVLGFVSGSGRPWKLVVQELSAKHLVERLTVFDSAEGKSFNKVCEVSSTGAPLQLTVGTMHGLADGSTAVGATRLVNGAPRAAVVRMSIDGSWSIVDLDTDAGCDPNWIGPNSAIIRVPKSLTRKIVRDGARFDAAGFEGAATSAACIALPTGAIRVIQAEPGFPYPLRELESSDAGLTWKPTRTLWGSAAGHAVQASVGGSEVVVFEGGDRARREHVLLLTLPRPTSIEAKPAKSATP